jgi:hypothetical protein
MFLNFYFIQLIVCMLTLSYNILFSYLFQNLTMILFSFKRNIKLACKKYQMMHQCMFTRSLASELAIILD